MRRSPAPYPVVIQRLVDDCIAAAKNHGVRGSVAVYESSGAETFYVIALRVPAAETVAARAMAPPGTKAQSPTQPKRDGAR